MSCACFLPVVGQLWAYSSFHNLELMPFSAFSLCLSGHFLSSCLVAILSATRLRRFTANDRRSSLCLRFPYSIGSAEFSDRLFSCGLPLRNSANLATWRTPFISCVNLQHPFLLLLVGLSMFWKIFFQRTIFSIIRCQISSWQQTPSCHMSGFSRPTSSVPHLFIRIVTIVNSAFNFSLCYVYDII